jgi:hypothetical protein
MRPRIFCVAFISAASLFAQQAGPIDDALIFPPSNELLRAAQSGYDGGKDLGMDIVYKPPWRDPYAHPCGRVTWEVKVAGPLLLAEMEGRTARTHAQGLPGSDDILHSQGTLLFQIVFFARKEEERATAALAVESREFHPLETYVNKIETVPCASRFNGGQYFAMQVRQTFTFGFAQGQLQPDWKGTVKLKVRRGNIVEPLELNLRQVLAEQAEKVRRNFH